MSPIPARAEPKSLKAAAPVFAALGDRTRLKVVARLSAGGPMSIRRLTDGTDVTRQAVTKHLHVLARIGLVRSRRRGRERIWELEPRQLAEARRCLEHISRQWDEGLERLKMFVEEKR
ncbi:MAG: ArsR/SmtB family transcription factor [Gammaproteobacteria bacterium]